MKEVAKMYLHHDGATTDRKKTKSRSKSPFKSGANTARTLNHVNMVSGIPRPNVKNLANNRSLLKKK